MNNHDDPFWPFEPYKIILFLLHNTFLWIKEKHDFFFLEGMPSTVHFTLFISYSNLPSGTKLAFEICNIPAVKIFSIHQLLIHSLNNTYNYPLDNYYILGTTTKYIEQPSTIGQLPTRTTRPTLFDNYFV